MADEFHAGIGTSEEPNTWEARYVQHAQGKIRVGISSCLLGNAVRYDGGHKHDRYLTEILGRHFEYVAYCPEMAIGLGAPRPPIRLVGDPNDPRALGIRNESEDFTEPLRRYADEVTEECACLSGYIFKRGSPSCGYDRVKVYRGNGMPAGSGMGIFAARLSRSLPLLPMEEEGRLRDPALRENFVMRVFVYDRWRRMRVEGVTAGGLVGFHSRHKYLLLAHSEPHYRRLGRLVAQSGAGEIEALADRYIAQLMEGLRKRTTRKRHANVLMHIMGYLKRDIDAGDKAELVRLIDEYRRGRIPLIVPLTMLKHYFRRCPNPYIALQYYLEPHPDELMLRNEI